jgi:4-alpha-glucanotransferase
MKAKRASGVLLQPTSFPGPWGIGELGSEAIHFLDFLHRAGQKLWQVMPLGPTSYGDSPYQCFSAFAGNPLLVSLEKLRAQGFLTDADLATSPAFPEDRVDFGAVIPFRNEMLGRAYVAWERGAKAEERDRFHAFRTENAGWLDDFALFMALKERNGGAPWNAWPDELKHRDPAALDRARHEFGEAILRHSFNQFLFFEHWAEVKAHAKKKRIRIIGDIPIFVAYDSSDVWAHRGLFHLDDAGNPTVVAGVPPDYFSETGQRWGNPLYRWEVMARTAYLWWIERFRQMLVITDIIRIDHFRGFEACWEVPASEPTAEHGKWVKGPGVALFQVVQNSLGDVPIIAEDLGLITPQVVALRKSAGFPGMRVLQFAFGSDATDPFLPHNYDHDTVVYTGTHDNDTSEGWFQTCTDAEREAFLEYTGRRSSTAHWEIIRLALASVADTAIMPLQDILGLGTEARMNFPGRAEGNWSWRYSKKRLDDGLAQALHRLVKVFGR